MNPSLPVPASRDFILRDLEGRTSTVTLTDDRVTLGRSNQNQLSYPDDVGLSRQHLAMNYKDGKWTVEDLHSKNGSMLNGELLKCLMPFNPGDRVAAGHLTIEFVGVEQSVTQGTVVFVEGD